MVINLEDLADFLVEAKKATYAGDGQEVPSQRPGFSELEYTKEDWRYRDSYTGFYSAPGHEVVYFEEKPVWMMSYHGGMEKKFLQEDFAKETFEFLKQALLLVESEKPFRGPDWFKIRDFEYVNSIKGDIEKFLGLEIIYYKEEIVFKQNYSGGIVVPK